MDRKIESGASDIYEAVALGEVRKFLKKQAAALSNASGNGNPSAEVDASIYGYDPKFKGSYHPGLDGQLAPHFQESGSGHTSFEEGARSSRRGDEINWAGIGGYRTSRRSEDVINWASLDGGSVNSDLF